MTTGAEARDLYAGVIPAGFGDDPPLSWPGSVPAMTEDGSLPTRWYKVIGAVYSGAALSPREFDSFPTSDATTITTAIRPTTSAQMALISGFTPSLTSE